MEYTHKHLSQSLWSKEILSKWSVWSVLSVNVVYYTAWHDTHSQAFVLKENVELIFMFICLKQFGFKSLMFANIIWLCEVLGLCCDAFEFLWVRCCYFRTFQSHLQVSINCPDMSVTNYQPSANHSDIFYLF